VQRSDGGFALSGGPVNAQSTAWAAQGLAAAGLSPASVRSGGRSALDYLASAQARDGHYRYSSSTDQTPVWVTGQALLAVNARPFPLAPVPRASSNDGAGVVGSGGGSGGPSPAAKGGTGPKPRAQAQPGPTTTSTASGADAAAVPFAPASSTEGSENGGGVPGWLVVVLVAAAIAGATWGGWLLYRRRLP
jgi:hypothetical protein